MNRIVNGCLRAATVLALAGLGVAATAPVRAAGPDDAVAMVRKAFEHMRGSTSISRTEMTIHRPDFTRTMTIRAWTRGKADALFFIVKPPRDAGNGTLKMGRQMWSYNPKVNRVIKLPPSMMSQGWMGSDFSNDDLSKTDSILEDYTHRIQGTESQEGLAVYRIESIPLEEAPVVWGKLEMTIRADGVLLRQAFFDEEMVLVKEMTTAAVQMLGGRPFPKVWTMQKAGETDRYTRLVYRELAFDQPLKTGLFTLTALKNRRF